MSLEAKIINIPGRPGMHAMQDTTRNAYAEGHRDARHAAAELAASHDALMQQMAEALQCLVTFLPSDHPEMQDKQRIQPGFVYIRWADLRQAIEALRAYKESQ